MCGKSRKNLCRLLLIGLLITLCGRPDKSVGQRKQRRVHSGAFGEKGSFHSDGWGYSDWENM